MSDDLVKHIREYLEAKLANDIEELEAQRRKLALCLMDANDQAVEAYQAQLEAEAKLEKAVELIEGMPILATYGDHVNWKRTTLAELKGGKG